MRIAVLNYSGNVGKTTLSRDLLKYRMPDHQIITVDSVNSDGKETLVIRGDKGDDIYTEMLLNENIILDIGSSNLDSFIHSTEKESEIIESIDLFVIPVTGEKKQQADSIKTMQDILIMGVQPEQIRIVFNQVNDNIDPKEVFEQVILAARKLNIPVNTENLIFRHDLYTNGQSLEDMISTTDYKSKMQESKAAGQQEKAREYAIKHVRQRKLASLDQRLADIFARIMS